MNEQSEKELRILVVHLLENQEAFKNQIANIESGVNTNRRQVEQLVQIQEEHNKIFMEHQKMLELLTKILKLLEKDK